MKKKTKKSASFFVRHWVALAAGLGSAVSVGVVVLLVIIFISQSAVTVGNQNVFSFATQETVREESYIEIDSAYNIAGDYGEAVELSTDELSAVASNATAIGVDVSVWQGQIDWAKVAADGIDFAIIRCGYRSYAPGDGSINVDSRFKENITGALANGIEVGVYFYSTAVNAEEAREEAEWVVSLISDYDITYPVAYDFEEFYNTDTTRAAGLSRLQLSQNTVAFLDYVEQAGYTPALYASASAIGDHWVYSSVSKYDYWLAHYTLKTGFTGDYTIWQCTNKGKVGGISGYVDLDICFADY